MLEPDVGCHVAVMCAQAVEKSIKGYLIFNGTTPEMSHRPDKYLSLLLDGGRFLRHRNHERKLGRLFDRATRTRIRGLLDLTPGGRGSRSDLPNTEYPWSDAHGTHVPMGHVIFADRQTASQWVIDAKRLANDLHRLVISAELVPL